MFLIAIGKSKNDVSEVEDFGLWINFLKLNILDLIGLINKKKKYGHQVWYQ